MDLRALAPAGFTGSAPRSQCHRSAFWGPGAPSSFPPTAGPGCLCPRLSCRSFCWCLSNPQVLTKGRLAFLLLVPKQGCPAAYQRTTCFPHCISMFTSDLLHGLYVSSRRGRLTSWQPGLTTAAGEQGGSGHMHGAGERWGLAAGARPLPSLRLIYSASLRPALGALVISCSDPGAFSFFLMTGFRHV